MRFLRQYGLAAVFLTILMGIIGAAAGSVVWWAAHVVLMFSRSECAIIGSVILAAACIYVFVRDWIHAQRYQQGNTDR